MFWQKLFIVAHHLCIWSWIITIFDSKKDKKIAGAGGSNRGIEGSPLWIVSGKNCRRKIFGFFKKKSKKWPTQDLSNIERNKVMKNQPIWSIPWGLAYNNQVFLTPPPCRIGLIKRFIQIQADLHFFIWVSLRFY